eukprot:14443277-Alexandrium_andersonii.AAC.1
MAALREQAQVEILALKGHVGTTRSTMEDPCSAWKAEFARIRDPLRVQLNGAANVGKRSQSLEDGLTRLGNIAH